MGGVPPQNLKRGELPTLATPPTSGTQNAGKPKANGGGKNGGPGGRSPHGRGYGGCPPTKPKLGANSPLWQPRHEWGPKRWRTQSQRGWEKRGPRGAKPPWRGVWGVPPQIQKKGRVTHISKPATSGAQNAGKPKANGGGQTGVQGGTSTPRSA